MVVVIIVVVVVVVVIVFCCFVMKFQKENERKKRRFNHARVPKKSYEKKEVQRSIHCVAKDEKKEVMNRKKKTSIYWVFMYVSVRVCVCV